MQLNCLPKGDKRNSWASLEWEDFYLLNKYLNNFQYYFLGSNIVSYGIYYAIGGFLHVSDDIIQHYSHMLIVNFEI